MQKYSSRNAIKCFGMRFKMLIYIIKCYHFAADNIFPYFRDAQAALIITPFFAIKFGNMRINKNAFKPRFIRIQAFLIIFLVFKNLLTVH